MDTSYALSAFAWLCLTGHDADAAHPAGRGVARRRAGFNRTAAGAAALLGALLADAAMAADLTLSLGEERRVDTATLLAHPDATTLVIPEDASYGRAMTYRAVPLRELLGVAELPEGKDLRLAAADGFVTVLPAALVFPETSPAATPWLAVEPEDAPWPKTPGGGATGPFYLVWTDPKASAIMGEQWPYAVVDIGLVASSAARWPWLEPDASVPADSPIRLGRDVVEAQCMTCHPVAGAGDATMGPDLNLPHSPTEYLQPWAFRAYLRDPASLRSWSGMTMRGFEADVLSEADLDGVVAYLDHLAERRPPAPQ